MSKDRNASEDLVNTIVLLLEAGCDITFKHKNICPYCGKDYVYENKECRGKRKRNEKRYDSIYNGNGDVYDDARCDIKYVAQITAKTNANL